MGHAPPLRLPRAQSQAEAFGRVQASFDSLRLMRRTLDTSLALSNFGDGCPINATLHLLLHAMKEESGPSSVPAELHDLRWQGPPNLRWEVDRLLVIHLEVFQAATEFFDFNGINYNNFKVERVGGPSSYMDAMMHILGMQGPSTPLFQSLARLEAHRDFCDAFVPDKGGYYGVVIDEPPVRALPLMTVDCQGRHLSFIGALVHTGSRHYVALIRNHDTWGILNDWRPVQPVSEDEAKVLIQEHGRIALYSVKE